MSLAKPQVLVVYHYFAHYRLPVMHELLTSENVDYIFAAGVSSEVSIKLIDEKQFQQDALKITGQQRWRSLSNHWLKGPLLWQSGLLKEILWGDYTAVIFLGSPYFLSTWLAIPLARLRGMKTLLWTHGAVRKGSFKDKLRLYFFSLGHQLLLYSHWAKRQLAQKGFANESMAVIYNSLNLVEQKHVRENCSEPILSAVKKKLFVQPTLPLLFFIGRLIPQKQLHELVRVVKILHQQGSPVNLLFIGDGEERVSLQQLSESLDIKDFVHFYGACHDEELLAPLIMASDVCVSPGGIGLTAIHALTYGTPVITHDNPAEQGPEFEAIVEGKTGLYYRYGEMNSLAEKIQQWLAYDVSREEIRKQCYEVIERFYNPNTQKEIIDRLILGDTIESIEDAMGKPMVNNKW